MTCLWGDKDWSSRFTHPLLLDLVEERSMTHTFDWEFGLVVAVNGKPSIFVRAG